MSLANFVSATEEVLYKAPMGLHVDPGGIGVIDLRHIANTLPPGKT